MIRRIRNLCKLDGCRKTEQVFVGESRVTTWNLSFCWKSHSGPSNNECVQCSNWRLAQGSLCQNDLKQFMVRTAKCQSAGRMHFIGQFAGKEPNEGQKNNQDKGCLQLATISLK